MTPHSLSYCPACGTSLSDERIEGRTRRYCRNRDRLIYRNPKPCAGVLVGDEREHVLLVKRTQPPAPGAWSVPAGYLEADEPHRHAAARELREETGLTAPAEGVRLFETTFVRHPSGQYVLVVIYTSARSATTGTVTAGSDAAAARFWNLSKLRSSGEQIEPGYGEILERTVSAFTTTD